MTCNNCKNCNFCKIVYRKFIFDLENLYTIKKDFIIEKNIICTNWERKVAKYDLSDKRFLEVENAIMELIENLKDFD